MNTPSSANFSRLLRACCTLAGVVAFASGHGGSATELGSSLSRGIAYRVFVGAFYAEAHARAMCQPLIEQGHPVTVAADPTGGTPLFVCRSQQTYDRPAAKEIADRIENESRLKPLVVAVRSSPGAARRMNSGEDDAATAGLDPNLRREFKRFMDTREDPVNEQLREEFERFMEVRERGALGR